jgi:serine/threonine-protein kinase
MAGEVLGSPDYMSPEQARGAENVGEATDIWTFTVVLYEMVTGKRPFDGPNYNALIAAILTHDAPPITAHGVGDSGLAGIVAHGLEKEIGARWPKIRDMGAALASWAVAAGIEDDLMGVSIAKQWLSGGVRRVFTVLPDDSAPLRSGVVAPDASASTAPARQSPPANVPFPASRPAGYVDQRRASARRALLLVVAIVLLGTLGVCVFLLRDRIADLRGSSPAASESAAAPPAAPATAVASTGASAAPAPSTAASPSSASPSASAPAEPALAPTGHPLPFKQPHKPLAPKVQRIKF